MDGVSAIALILIASFGIDRIVTGILFLLGFLRTDPATMEPGPERARAERNRKLWYYVLAALLGGGVLAYFGEVRIFSAMGFPGIPVVLDSIMTGLILMAGADRISGLLKMGGAGAAGATAAAPEARPIEITGKLTLENPPGGD